MIKQGVSR